MDGIGIATFALRLTAIYVWIHALLQVFLLPTMLLVFSQAQPAPSPAGFFVSLALELLLGSILWFASGRLARRFFEIEERQPLRGAAEIGGLALRLAGIWLLDETLQRTGHLVFLVQNRSSGSVRSNLGAEIAAFSVLALTALILTIGGGRIAKRAFPSADRAGSIAASLPPVAFGVLGLVILAGALPEIVSEIVRNGFRSEDGSLFGLMSAPPAGTGDATIVLRALLGLALFLGSGPLTRFWRWVHTAGLERGPAT